jgi:hypothetical protein
VATGMTAARAGSVDRESMWRFSIVPAIHLWDQTPIQSSSLLSVPTDERQVA